jgi:hypothetical protein
LDINPADASTALGTKPELQAVAGRWISRTRLLNRCDPAAIEQALQHGPVHLLKRNRSAAVVLSEQHYSQLQLQASPPPVTEASALH